MWALWVPRGARVKPRRRQVSAAPSRSRTRTTMWSSPTICFSAMSFPPSAHDSSRRLHSGQRLTLLRRSTTFGKATTLGRRFPRRYAAPFASREEPIMATTYPIESLEAHPPYLYPGYRSTVRRAPSRPLVIIPHTLSELTGPVYGHESVREHDGDLTRQHAGEPLGERIVVSGRVLDEDGRPVPNTLVEIW